MSTPTDPTAVASGDPMQRPGFNPFPGLRPFREDEEYLYFGREHQSDALTNRLAETHFLAVVGTSGSGKSSLVNCGLCPALHRGQMSSAGSAWRVARLRPGSTPLRELAEALARPDVLFATQDTGDFSQAELVESTLRASKLGLIDLFEQARLPPRTNLLIIVDQFEELFRYRTLSAASERDDARIREDATAFMNLLLEVPAHAELAIYVVLTMRSDFLGDCAQFYGLPEAINRGQYLVPRLTRDERRTAIAGPIAVGGASIDPVLLTRLVNDVGDNPDQLSQLQHALNRTWARWYDESRHDHGRRDASGDTAAKPSPITLRHYESVGTIAHALNQHAEETFESLPEGAPRQLCEALFKAITDRRSDARGVRRPTRFDTLCTLIEADPEKLIAVIDAFRDPRCAFLMPPAGEIIDADSVIDISHESLMRVWMRLRQWGDEEAQSARVLRRIAKTAELHAAGQANLLRNPELQLAIDWRCRQRPTPAWASRYHPALDAALDLIDCSQARFEFEQAEAARRQAEETELKAQVERTRRQRKLILATTVAALLVASGFGYLYQKAVDAQRIAQQERIEARASEARALAAKAEAEEALIRARRWADQRDAVQNQLDAALAAAPPMLGPFTALTPQQPVVYLQTPAGQSRDAAVALQNRLLSAGYKAPGIEGVQAAPRRFELRYFHDDDKPGAQRLGEQIREWEFPAIQVVRTPGFETRSPKQQYEIWFPASTGVSSPPPAQQIR